MGGDVNLAALPRTVHMVIAASMAAGFGMPSVCARAVLWGWTDVALLQLGASWR